MDDVESIVGMLKEIQMMVCDADAKDAESERLLLESNRLLMEANALRRQASKKRWRASGCSKECWEEAHRRAGIIVGMLLKRGDRDDTR